MRTHIAGLLAAASLTAFATYAWSQDSTQDDIAKYREMLQEDNPADLWELKGEALWKEKRGPENASLEQCDLGKGAGVVKGVYAELPRHFGDTGKVQDVESRLVTCIVTLQGFKPEDVTKNPFSAPGRPSDMEALVSYLAAQSSGMKLNVPIKHPKEIEAFANGEQLFYRRAGSHDFACATCHADQGKRIRRQELPKLTEPREAQKIFPTWPAYRVSQGTVRTMEHRLYDCYWQMRHPQVTYTSDAVIALQVFMARYANGGEIHAPSMKR